MCVREREAWVGDNTAWAPTLENYAICTLPRMNESVCDGKEREEASMIRLLMYQKRHHTLLKAPNRPFWLVVLAFNVKTTPLGSDNFVGTPEYAYVARA